MFLALYENNNNNNNNNTIIQERKRYTFLSCWHNNINQSIMADHRLYVDLILNKRYIQSSRRSPVSQLS